MTEAPDKPAPELRDQVAPWVRVIKNASAFHCERCGVTAEFKLPLEVSTYRVLEEAFAKKHAECTLLSGGYPAPRGSA